MLGKAANLTVRLVFLFRAGRPSLSFSKIFRYFKKIPYISSSLLLFFQKEHAKIQSDMDTTKPTPASSAHSPVFLAAQKAKLLDLRDDLLDSIHGVAKDALRVCAEDSDSRVGGVHMGDAGSDAYDRGFALSMLSRGQDALYEIEDSIERINKGTYGICEVSGVQIPTERLEAIPFARCTVAEQSRLEKTMRNRPRVIETSLFGLTDDAERDEDEDAEPVEALA